MRYVLIQTLLLGSLMMVAITGVGPYWGPARLLGGDAGNILRLVGGSICGASVLLALVAGFALGPAFRVAPAPRGRAPLVTRGIYRYLRHPMYTAASGASFGLLLLRPTVLVAMLALTTIAFYLQKSRHEERLLRERYPEYRNYVTQTRGVVPFQRWW